MVIPLDGRNGLGSIVGLTGQIDGMMVADQTLMVGLGIESQGEKNPLVVMERATENAAVVRALIADLKDRDLLPNFSPVRSGVLCAIDALAGR